MKTYINLFFILFLASQSAMAKAPLIEETKIVEKTFNVKSDATLDINNRYGNVTMTTWDKKTIEIKVEIKVDGRNPNLVKNRLDRISIDFNSTQSLVSATTKISELKGGNNTNIQINYFIKLPKSNNITISNRYGNVYLDETSGSTQFNLNYGNLTAGKFHNPLNTFNLKYMTSVKIDHVKSATFNVDYSKIDIKKIDVLKMNSKYTDFKIETVKDVICDMDYGNLNISSAEKISGTLDYTNLKIGNIKKSLTYSGGYGTVSITKINQGFQNILISGNYITVDLGVEKSARYNLLANLRYGSLKYPNNLEINKSIEKSNNKYYEGKTANPSGKIELNLTYGNAKINLTN